jgi:hypothetical protein
LQVKVLILIVKLLWGGHLARPLLPHISIIERMNVANAMYLDVDLTPMVNVDQVLPGLGVSFSLNQGTDKFL